MMVLKGCGKYTARMIYRADDMPRRMICRADDMPRKAFSSE